MSGIGALFRPLPRMGPRLPFELPAPPRPHLPMPAPRPLPRPAPGALPRPVPRPMPVPQTLPRTETGTLSRDRTREAERDCSKSQGRDKDCVECPPSQGEMAIANNGKGHSMSDLSARYQQWVTNFPFPHEWFWSGTWWDGFDEPRCTLLEAKANYAFLFVPLLGVPRPWARAKVKSDLLQKAEVHSDKARPTPPVFVEWHFLQRIVYEYCAAEYLRMGLANLKAFWNPMPGTDEHDDYQETRAKEQEEMKGFAKRTRGIAHDGRQGFQALHIRAVLRSGTAPRTGRRPAPATDRALPRCPRAPPSGAGELVPVRRLLRDALSHNVTEHRQDLAKALSRDRRTRAVELVLWNGEEDPLKGGLSLDYEASGRAVSSRLQLEDAGSLLQVFDAPASSFVAIFLAALEIWPETTWGMLAPHTYFVHQRTFPDRRSIGWIGFCPHPLRATDFPAATELVDIPGRGTLLLNGREPMDETRREHFERVGEADIKLMELGYLPPLRG